MLFNGDMRHSLRHRTVYLCCVLLILAVGVPWYWEDAPAAWTLWDIPVWALASFASGIALAAVTAWAAWNWWPKDPGEDHAD